MRHATIVVFLSLETFALADDVERAARSWKASCARPDETGACVAQVALAPAAPRTRCGPSSIATSRAIPRLRRRAAQARERLLAAAKVADREGADRARFLLAEEQYEAVLAVRFPADLDFSAKPERSRQRFDAWKADLEHKVATAETAYLDLTGSVWWAGAAWARLGELYAQVAVVFWTAPVPPIPRDFPALAAGAGLPTHELADEFVGAFCSALGDLAEMYRKKAVAAVDRCGTAPPWSRRCAAIRLRVEAK